MIAGRRDEVLERFKKRVRGEWSLTADHTGERGCEPTTEYAVANIYHSPGSTHVVVGAGTGSGSAEGAFDLPLGGPNQRIDMTAEATTPMAQRMRGGA